MKITFAMLLVMGLVAAIMTHPLKKRDSDSLSASDSSEEKSSSSEEESSDSGEASSGSGDEASGGEDGSETIIAPIFK